MKYAKSLLYGIIVDAAECDYRDYSNWQLRCPKCGEPVYLIGASKRQEHARLAPKSKEIVLVKSSEISPSFAHFKGLADEQCENFNRQIDKGYINRFGQVNREQRLKIYNSRFLEIVGYDKKEMKGCFFTAFKKVNGLDNKLCKGIEKEVVKDFYDVVSTEDTTKFYDHAKALLEKFKAAADPLTYFDTSRANDEAKLGFLRWVRGIDTDMQMTLVVEAIAFLKTRAAKAIALELFELAFFRMIFRYEDGATLLKIGEKAMEEENIRYTKMIQLCVTDLIEIFVLTDWAGEIN